MSVYDGRTIPWRVYHGVPAGWRAEDIVQEHARLGGCFPLRVPAPIEVPSLHAVPEQDGWLHYRLTVHRLAEGVRASDPACIELAVRYIQLHYIGSYAGYLRARLARALKHAPLQESQRRVLHQHFAALSLRGEHTHEFPEYLKLWRRIVRPEEREALAQAFRDLPDGERRATRWESLMDANGRPGPGGRSPSGNMANRGRTGRRN
ncbi:MAG TPA: hypothetical protein VFH59_05940 [Frateuria sp.]|uniref:hypothetical protein n=1 Tax=Frateuria sp. TaxID=2211372 RepID=UPI002D7E2E7B|nr:hypothetical protein [Frateuria sp.]HET6804971.1 hypothetical protein [Frateuria sp.]